MEALVAEYATLDNAIAAAQYAWRNRQTIQNSIANEPYEHGTHRGMAPIRKRKREDQYDIPYYGSQPKKRRMYTPKSRRSRPYYKRFQRYYKRAAKKSGDIHERQIKQLWEAIDTLRQKSWSDSLWSSTSD